MSRYFPVPSQVTPVLCSRVTNTVPIQALKNVELHVTVTAKRDSDLMLLLFCTQCPSEQEVRAQSWEERHSRRFSLSLLALLSSNLGF